MKDRIDWIEQLNEKKLAALTPQIGKHFIAPSREKDEKMYDRIEEISEKRVDFPFTFTRIVKYAAAVLILIGAGIMTTLFLTRSGELNCFHMIINGDVVVRKGRESRALEIHQPVVKGNTIITGESSSYVFHVAGQAVFRLSEHTRVSLDMLTKGKAAFGLTQGELSINTKETEYKTLYKVSTPDARIQFGSSVIVYYGAGRTTVTLLYGKASVQAILNGSAVQEMALEEGQRVRIEKGIIEKDESVDAGEYPLPAVLSFVTVRNKTGILEITTDHDNAELLVDHKLIDGFNRKISMVLNPGTYGLTVRKEGFTDYNRTVTLEQNQVVSVKAMFAEEKAEKEELSLGVRIIYRYHNRDNPQRSGILGFAVSASYAVAVTRTSVVCFDTEGSVLFEKVFGEAERIIFDSLPLIVHDRCYISTIDRILIFSLPGGRITHVDAPGMLSDGSRMIFFKDRIWIPYPAGIFVFSPADFTFKPIVRYQNSLVPLIIDNHVYAVSYVENTIASFSIDGKPKVKKTLESICIAPPIGVGSGIVCGDTAGHCYYFSPDLELIDKKKLPGTIETMAGGPGPRIFIMTGSGELYCIDLVKDNLVNPILVDKNNNYDIYFDRNPVFINDDLFLGTRNGEITAVDGFTKEVTGVFKIVDDPISCSVYSFREKLIKGTKKGKVILIEK